MTPLTIWVDRYGKPCDSMRHDAKRLEVVPASELLELSTQITRLRNAMGDVRGMQTDGATPEQMDRALARALEGKLPRGEFDKDRAR